MTKPDEVRHRMVPGSHERPRGPECRCGAEWDWWDDHCIRVAESDTPVLSVVSDM